MKDILVTLSDGAACYRPPLERALGVATETQRERESETGSAVNARRRSVAGFSDIIESVGRC